MSVEDFEDHSPDVDITFTKEDLRDVVPHDNDPIVISLVTAGRMVHRVLVDQGSSADVMFWPTFEKLQLSPDQLRPYGGCLYGFAGDQVEANSQQDRSCAFNKAHEGQVITIRSDQKKAKKCYENSLKNKRSVCHVTTTSPLGVEPEQGNRRVVDTALEVAAEGDVAMEDVEARSESAARVEEEKNCPETARESGQANPPEKEKVQRRKETGNQGRDAENPCSRPIREIQYPEWLANVVLVKKSSGK
ncbi:uncharacterized protein [Phaseolus vulgaris]|uniref:uncharacterized protein n=1 Tax=Phaseolus vulgaris TaxID=3885 RepID=UPI0035CBFA91